MSSLLVLKIIRIVFLLTMIGGFLTSMYLLPLMLAFACDSEASSQLECLGKGATIIGLHFFAPLFFYIQLSHRFNMTTILLAIYGLLMIAMVYVTGYISLSIGVVTLIATLLFFLQRHESIPLNITL